MALDFSRFGTPVGGTRASADQPFTGYGGFTAPPPAPAAPSIPSNLDFSTFGTPVRPTPAPQTFGEFERIPAETALQPDPFAIREQRVQEAMAPAPMDLNERRQKVGKLRAKYIDYRELWDFLDELEADEELDYFDLEKEFLYAVGEIKDQRKQQEQGVKLAEKAAKDEERRFDKFRKEQLKQEERAVAAQLQDAEKQEKKAIDAEKFVIGQETKLTAEQIKAQAKAPPERAQPTRRAIQREPTLGQTAAGMGAEIAIGGASQVAGTALAPFTAGISYPVLSFAGGFAGSLAAQEIEGRREVSYGRAIRDGLLNLIPGLKPVKGATTAARVAKAAVKGAAVGVPTGVAGEVIETGIEEERLPTFDEMVTGGLFAGTLGAGFGASGEALKSAFRKFAGKPVAELDKAYARGDKDAALIVEATKGASKEAPPTASEASRQALAQQRLDEEAAERARIAEESLAYEQRVRSEQEEFRKQREAQMQAEEVIRRREAARAPAPEPMPEPTGIGLVEGARPTEAFPTREIVEPPRGRAAVYDARGRIIEEVEPTPPTEPGRPEFPKRPAAKPFSEEVTFQGQKYKKENGKWFNVQSGIEVKTKRRIQELEDALSIGKTETLPVGEGAEGRPPVDEGVRVKAEDQVPQAEVTPTPVKPTMYHGSPEKVQAFLPREPKSLDSLGLFMTGSPEQARRVYGKNVYEVEPPKNLLDVGSRDIANVVGENDALIRQFVGDKQADHLKRHPYNADRLAELRKKLNSPEGLTQAEGIQYRNLETSKKYNAEIMGNEGYIKAYRQMLEDAGYDGIRFTKTKLDGEEQDIVVAFNKEEIAAKEPTQPPTPAKPVEAGAPARTTLEEAPSIEQAKPLPGVTRKSGFVGVAKQKPAVQVQPSSDPDVRAVNDALDRQQKDFERAMLGKGKQATDSIAEGLWDSQSLAKRKLLAADMKEAEARLILRRGWAAEARTQFDERLKNIDKLITHGNEKTFSEYLEMRRLVEVSDLKSAKGEDYDLPYGITPEQAKKWVAEFERQKQAEGTLGTYQAAANEYYKAAKDQLDAMKNEGLLTQEAYDSLVANHKNYSPQQMIQYLDPEDTSGLVGKGAGAPIKALKGGSESGRVTDYRYLMARTIAAGQNRIFANRANKALVSGISDPNAAKEIGAIIDDGTLDKIPFGYKRIKAFENGQEKSVFVPEEFAKSWEDSDPVLKKATADFLRTWSGSRLIKAQATGYNPEFIISNFPRDAAYAWFRTDEYSPVLPIGAMQQAKDYIETAKDAFTGGGKYREYLKEGGGLDGLAAEGRLDKNPWEKVTPTNRVAKDIARFAGYLGEASERWTRLAVYNRAIKNGKSPMEAAKIARDMLDFAQGGKAVKAADTVIPYLNAATQGTRGLARAFTENGLGKQSFKAGQVMALAAGLGAIGREYFKEEWEAISDYEKASKWIIPLPESFAYTDENGRKRFRYIAIAKDQGQGAFAAIADSMVALARGEKVNGKAAMEAFLQAFPDVAAGSPIYNAMQAYFDNYDSFRKEDIYKGRPTTPSTEFSDVEILDKAAQELSRLSGGAIELSPLRLKRATEKLVLPHNPLTMLTGLAANEMLPEEVQTQFAEESITRQPFIRRFIRSTPPVDVPASVAEKAERLGVETEGKAGKAVRQEVYEAEQQLGAQRNIQDREIRRIMSRIKKGEATKDELLEYIQQFPEDYTRLRNRAKTIQEEFGLQLYLPPGGGGSKFGPRSRSFRTLTGP